MCCYFHRILNGRAGGERKRNKSTRASSILLPHAIRANDTAPATITATATPRGKLTSPVLDSSSNRSDEPIANRAAAVTVPEKKTHQVICQKFNVLTVMELLFVCLYQNFKYVNDKKRSPSCRQTWRLQ